MNYAECDICKPYWSTKASSFEDAQNKANNHNDKVHDGNLYAYPVSK